jgi:hypothetical protein
MPADNAFPGTNSLDGDEVQPHQNSWSGKLTHDKTHRGPFGTSIPSVQNGADRLGSFVAADAKIPLGDPGRPTLPQGRLGTIQQKIGLLSHSSGHRGPRVRQCKQLGRKDQWEIVNPHRSTAAWAGTGLEAGESLASGHCREQEHHQQTFHQLAKQRNSTEHKAVEGFQLTS